MAFESRRKSAGIAFLLWFLLGMLGGHRFYAGKSASATLMALMMVTGVATLVAGVGVILMAVVCIWALIDVFLIASWIRSANERMAEQVMGAVALPKSANDIREDKKAREKAAADRRTKAFVTTVLPILAVVVLVASLSGKQRDGAVDTKAAEDVVEVSAIPAATRTDAPKAATAPAVSEKPEAKYPTESHRSAIFEKLNSLQWDSAWHDFQALNRQGYALEELVEALEAKAVEVIRPLPASMRETNLEGYRFLSRIRPENATYRAKVDHYESAIEAHELAVLAKLRREEDKVEGVTWYKHPNQPRYLNSRSTVYLYIGRRGEGRPWLRMKTQYTSEDWLFVERAIAWHDGVKETLTTGPFERDHNTTIWEWADESPDSYQLQILRSIAEADEAILRFEGSQYRRDKTLSDGDKRALREMMEAYRIMAKDN